MVKSSRDDTIRKEFQRIQESNRNAFEHSGQQQLKRMPNGQQAASRPSPHHQHHGSAFNDYNKQQMSMAQPGYRASAAYPISKESPREHVKMRHDPRLGQQPRIGVAGMPAAEYRDQRRHSRPISHHQAVVLDF
jgi:hypothetical protein